MSDAPPGGSAYGRGYYGKGPYGAATRIFGMFAGTRITVRPLPVIAEAQLRILGTPAMAFGLTQLWAPIDVPPCQPWEAIGTPSCSQAVPNSAGKMFPGMES
jgi:hypothetical protein